jgi:hypothetical protein
MATPPDFTAGQVLTAAQMNAVGMWKITPSSVSGTGATIAANGSVVVASGGTSVTLEGVFSADYENYEVIFSNWRGSAVGALQMQLRVGGSTSATGYYYSTCYGAGNYSGTVNMTAVGAANQTTFLTDALCGTGAGSASGAKATLYQPNLASTTGFTGLCIDQRTSGNGRHGFSGFHSATTAYTGLVVSATLGNFTSLTVSVYGYN